MPRTALLALVVAVTACSSNSRDDATLPPPSGPAPAPTPSGPDTRPTVVLASPTGDVVVHVEVVATPATIERGLMYRQNLPPDDGMLFLMGKEYDWTFWMHNTLIALDMIFIKKDMTVGGIVQRAEPRTDTMRSVGVQTLYVLEVNGGWDELHKVAAGAKVTFNGVKQ